MDNDTLSAVLADRRHRQFWIVLWGDPTHSPDEDAQIFDKPLYDHGLTRDERNMRVGDILFVHRIKISKIIFVGEVIEQPRKSRADEIENEEWRSRWTWSVALKNLTPTYGLDWRKRAERTFTLKDQYNQLNPKDPVNIGRLQRGSHVQIPAAFAEYLIGEILSLD